MTGDDDLSQINALKCIEISYFFGSMLFKSLGDPFMQRNQISRQRGCFGASAASPGAMQGCKDQSNIGT